MSNIKRVDIRGSIPFNVCDSGEACNLLGQLNAPLCGIRITYETTFAPTFKGNEYGGKTAFYQFAIHGQEAVSWDWLQRLVDVLKAAGAEISRASCYDIEGQQAGSLRI